MKQNFKNSSVQDGEENVAQDSNGTHKRYKTTLSCKSYQPKLARSDYVIPFDHEMFHMKAIAKQYEKN